MKPIYIRGHLIEVEQLMEWTEALGAIQKSAMRERQFALATDMVHIAQLLLEVASRLDAVEAQTGQTQDAPGRPRIGPDQDTPSNGGTDSGPILGGSQPSVSGHGAPGGNGGNGAPVPSTGLPGAPAVCSQCGSGPWFAPGKRRAIVTWKQKLICSTCLMGELT